MKYYPLEKIYHMNKDIETEYNNRFNSPTSFITNLTISPFIKGNNIVHHGLGSENEIITELSFRKRRDSYYLQSTNFSFLL